MALGPEAWDDYSRGSALRRAGRSSFLRSVAVALGNWRSPEAVPVLIGALSESDPLVRAT
jgi:epoxyqueuosine reductase QueG